MSSKSELKLAYGLAVILLIVGVLSYTAFSSKTPDQPVRLMFKNAAGKVLFDHKTHTDDSGYGISCYDCHHHPEDDESALRACSDCHLHSDQAEEGSLKACMECHESEELEDIDLTNKTDAFHSQYIKCHQEFEAGPAECSACHIM